MFSVYVLLFIVYLSNKCVYLINNNNKNNIDFFINFWSYFSF